jgi:uncharacterized protein with PIN domain
MARATEEEEAEVFFRELRTFHAFSTYSPRLLFFFTRFALARKTFLHKILTELQHHHHHQQQLLHSQKRTHKRCVQFPAKNCLRCNNLIAVKNNEIHQKLVSLFVRTYFFRSLLC